MQAKVFSDFSKLSDSFAEITITQDVEQETALNWFSLKISFQTGIVTAYYTILFDPESSVQPPCNLSLFGLL